MSRWPKKVFTKSSLQDRLRDKLVEMYGEEAGEMYDNINMGMSIGGFVESAIFMGMIEDAGKALEE